MKKTKKVLVCTPIDKLIPKNKKNILIFPPNLVSNSISPVVKNFKHKEPKFRWSNKSILYQDYVYLKKFYEKSLDSLSKSLNEHHKKNYSKKFWRILIGPWLSSILFVIFERYYEIKSCYNKYKIDQVNFLRINNNVNLIPIEIEDYLGHVHNILWNQYLYQEIISNLFEKKKILYVDGIVNKGFPKRIKSIKKTKINSLITKIFNFNPINKFYNYFLSSTYLGMIDELKLSLKLKQFPIFYEKKELLSISKIDKETRNKIGKKNNLKNNFEKTLYKIAINKIPIYLLEDFKNLCRISKNLNYPNKPKVIFSSNFLWYDLVTMCYSAMKIENETKLIYGQHGGSYGINKIIFSEDHEIKISDRYISWGWKKNNEKINNFGIISNTRKFSRKENSDKLLILFRLLNKYFFSMGSGDDTELAKDYISYCTSFFNNLSSEIRKNTVLRLQTNSADSDYTNEVLKNFSKKNGNLKLSNSTFFSDCNNSKLIVNTCNSTPFLQTISLNFPSIVIWNKLNNPIRKEAIKYIGLLHKNKILFYDPKKAAKFINKIWENDINEWWLSNKTQYAIKKFSEIFSKNNVNILSNLKDQIKNYEN